MKIVTPTYKRPDNIRAFKIFGKDIIIACHSSEKHAYLKNYPDNDYLIIPDKLKGNMAVIRNYIRRRILDDVLMVDDDVHEIGYHQDNVKQQMGLGQIYAMLENARLFMKEIGAHLFGINLQSDPMFYRENNPFSFITPVLGPFTFVLKSNKLKYDERLSLNEDYDYFIQNIYRYRKTLRFNKYYYTCGHVDQPGGCSTNRTVKKEEKQAQIMIKKWGNDIVRYDFEKSFNPRVRIPIKGI